MTNSDQDILEKDEFSLKAEITKATRAAMITGLAMLALGIFAMVYPQEVGSILAKLLGIILIVGGCLRFIFAIWSFSFGNMIWRYALAVIMFLVGFWIYSNPEISLNVLTLLVGGYFLIDGINQIGYYRSIRHFGSGPYLFIDGLISIVLAVLIFAKWPESSNYVLGIYIGLKVAMDGFSFLITGWITNRLINSGTADQS